MTVAALQASSELRRAAWHCLSAIDDPEMPVSIVDLGIVQGVDVVAGNVRVTILPTYTGCAALDVIDEHIRSGIGALLGVEQVQIEHVFDPPWTADRISQAGRERLRQHGVTVADRRFVQLNLADPAVVHCPFCQSERTRLDSPFGPTRCRAIYYCLSCHNTFEHIKAA